MCVLIKKVLIMTYAVFNLADKQKYALSIENVVEVIKASAVSEVPGADPGTVGIASLRGEAVTVKSPHIAIGHISEDEALSQEFWLVCEREGNKFAIMIDSLQSIEDIPDESWDASWESNGLVKRVANHDDGLIQEISLDMFLN